MKIKKKNNKKTQLIAQAILSFKYVCWMEIFQII